MSWVRRGDRHRCAVPRAGSFGTPDGEFGDVWRCECRALWRIGYACDACDLIGHPQQHSGAHVGGKEWRPAHAWQRVLYWRRGRKVAS